MKRLIVVIISILFLSVFLMMNYLLWDKDNLLKQQESDMVQQDWLRGQNKAMEANITELEQSNAALEKDKATLNEQYNTIQRQIRAATERETNLRKMLDNKILSVEALKTASLPILKEEIAKWMTAVNEGRSADSFLSFSQNFQIMKRSLTQETYQKFLETNISILSYTSPDAAVQKDGTAANSTVKDTAAKDAPVKETTAKDGTVKGEEAKPTAAPEPVILFERIGNESSDLTVLVRTQVYATLKPEADKSIPSFQEGLNSVQIQFIYDVMNQKWYIQSITGTN